MFKSKKYYKHKKIRKILKDSSTENREKDFYNQKGYVVKYTVSRTGKKHPLGKELCEIVPLFKETYIQTLDDYKEPELIISKQIFDKLSISQKSCFDHKSTIYKEPNKSFYYDTDIIFGVRLLPSLRQYIKPIIKKNYVEIYSYCKTELYHHIKRNALWDIGTKIMGWRAKHRYEDRELYDIKQNKILKDQMKLDLEE
ncbi:MAG: hypothetical protein M0R17_03300 [Candidatus Omnitrophica bacterium]|jgi:hypothetical protein|nr:hypothetical protein [Candidatus Omnitrophota bacterium]